MICTTWWWLYLPGMTAFRNMTSAQSLSWSIWTAERGMMSQTSWGYTGAQTASGNGSTAGLISICLPQSTCPICPVRMLYNEDSGCRTLVSQSIRKREPLALFRWCKSAILFDMYIAEIWQIVPLSWWLSWLHTTEYFSLGFEGSLRKKTRCPICPAVLRYIVLVDCDRHGNQLKFSYIYIDSQRLAD